MCLMALTCVGEHERPQRMASKGRNGLPQNGLAHKGVPKGFEGWRNQI